MWLREAAVNFEAIVNFLGSLTFSQATWLFPLVFALHVLEEAPQFRAWAQRYTSSKFTQGDFVRNNAMGMVIGIVFCLAVWFFPNRITVFLFFSLGINQSFLNTLFHVGTTAAYGVYSPGLITSLTLYPPLFYYLSRLAYKQNLISTRGGIGALVVAAVIHAVVVAQQVYFVKFSFGRRSVARRQALNNQSEWR